MRKTKYLKFIPVLIAVISFLSFSLISTINNPIPTKIPIKLSDVKPQLSNDNLKVHFIDVGGGLCMFIQTPNGKNIFIDGGKGSNDDLENVSLYVEEFLPKTQ